ncbi:MAG TPA: 2-phosphosulfolactate phosphatase [Bacteroidota bacterium]|nr:2-phosphosulfolactate phosphatase [Bacteroidota bacterium]
MKIEVFFSPSQVDELSLREKNVIVIDVLRASTTIATALLNGAREIIPVNTVESAVKISGNLFGDVVLRGGERNGKMIEGFNLGNSPAEYTIEAVKGKSIIFCTTNGSSAIVKARHAKNLVVAGFINMSSVLEFIKEIGEDFCILCAGKQSLFCIEDSVCAGMIITELMDDESLNIELNDPAVAASTLYKSMGKNLQRMVRATDHGKYLYEIGFKNDIKLCTDIDSVPVLPMLVGNSIKLRKKETLKPAPETDVSAQ